ncbi:hypothetical protein CVV72_10375 [Amycolatopsis sp. TNS106]|nr:hypothetical protein CVV72_10375 [Amycolatopsis sp. TNS106]
MSLGILAVVLAASIASHRLDAARAANDSTIAAQEGQLSDLLAGSRDADSRRMISAAVSAAAIDAEKVRAAQQAYATLYHRASTEPPTNNGVPTEASEATAEHRKILAPLFSRKTYLVEDENAYRWQNVLPFDPDTEIDPRFPWYVRYVGSTAAKPDTYAWAVEAVTPDRPPGHSQDPTATAKVVWLCKDTQTGAVLAWARATYDYRGTSGAFDHLEIGLSAVGAAQQYPSGQTPQASSIPELEGPRSLPGVERGGR